MLSEEILTALQKCRSKMQINQTRISSRCTTCGSIGGTSLVADYDSEAAVREEHKESSTPIYRLGLLNGSFRDAFLDESSCLLLDKHSAWRSPSCILLKPSRNVCDISLSGIDHIFLRS